jgi:hypothetical protein
VLEDLRYQATMVPEVEVIDLEGAEKQGSHVDALEENIASAPNPPIVSL